MVDNSLTTGENGLHLTSIEWLAAHNGAKIEERKTMIGLHDLRYGDKVLDLGCGPGYWTRLIADRIGAAGKFVGMDFDEKLIAFAMKEHDDLLVDGIAEYICGNIAKLPFQDEVFDVVICGNTYNYTDNISDMVSEHVRVLKPNGRFIVRTFDNTSSIYYPIPTKLLLNIMQGAAMGLERHSDSAQIDNYLGKKMHGLMASMDFLTEVQTTTFLTQKVQPLDNATRTYLQLKATWYANMAENAVQPEDVKAWRFAFDDQNPDCILDSSKFYFSTVEMITSAVKKSNKKRKENVAILFDAPETRTSTPDFQFDVERYTDDTIQLLCGIIENLGFECTVFSDTSEFGLQVLSQKLPKVKACINLGTGRLNSFRAGQAATFLEMSGIPYSGSDPQALLMCRDKIMTKRIASSIGISVPPGTFISEDNFHTLNELSNRLFPVFVKPNFEACSAGIKNNILFDIENTKLTSRKLLQEYPDGIIVEKFIPGMEVTVFMVSNGPERDVIPLVMRRLDGTPLPKDFVRVYDSKLASKNKQTQVWHLGEDILKPSVQMELISITNRLASALNLRDFARIDYRISEIDEIYFIECNGQPGIHHENSVAKILNNKYFKNENGLQKRFLEGAFKRLNISISDNVLSMSET